MKDEEYDSMVMAKVKSMDFKKRALDKLGVDEDQVKEIVPIHFEGYWYDLKNAFARRGKDGLWRSSAYQITWLFCSSTHIHAYQCTLNMDEDGKKEETPEFAWKFVTNCNVVSDTVEKETVDKVSCKGDITYKRTNVDTTRFMISASGDKFYCAVEQNDYATKSVNGMRAKLREKQQ